MYYDVERNILIYLLYSIFSRKHSPSQPRGFVSPWACNKHSRRSTEERSFKTSADWNLWVPRIIVLVRITLYSAKNIWTEHNKQRIYVFNFPQLQRTSGCCIGLRIRWSETDRGNRWNSETWNRNHYKCLHSLTQINALKPWSPPILKLNKLSLKN